MAPDLRAKLGHLGGRAGQLAGKSGQRDELAGDAPITAATPLEPRFDGLAGDAPLVDIAARLDIGAQAFIAARRHGYDIDAEDVAGLLDAVARSARARGRRAYLQVPGRCLELTGASPTERARDVDGHVRLRLLTTNAAGHLDENVAVELWKQADRAYRSLSDDAPVRLSVPGAALPELGPARTEDDVDFPIDVVYTWVDASDLDWRAMAEAHLDLDTLEGDLYEQSDELRYSLRSIETFAPWVNHIHVLSNCAPPRWFEPSGRVSWVDHAQVADADLLPLFNSGAIDTLVHRVPGLSEHFLYLNDDFMLWDSVTPSTFYTWDDRSIAHMATNSSLIYLQQLVEAGRAAPSQHSRVNAARLMLTRYGVFPTRLHGHVPYALRRSVFERIEREFAEEIAATRASRTRSVTDTSFMAYLYHHYAYINGLAIYADAPQSFVTLHNYQRPAMQRALRQTRFACFQDSRGSATDASYQTYKRASLQIALPLPSMAEASRDGGIGAP